MVIVIIVEFIVSGALLILAGIIALHKYRVLQAHLKELNVHGNDAV